MGESDEFDVSFSSKLLALCIHNMPVTITHLASLSTSLCGRLGPDLTSALIPKRISHEYGRHPDVANSLPFTETGVEHQIYIVRVVNPPLFRS